MLDGSDEIIQKVCNKSNEISEIDLRNVLNVRIVKESQIYENTLKVKSIML